MIARLLARLGLQVAAPLLVPIVLTLVMGGSLGGYAWWNELADALTTILVVLAGLCYVAALVVATLGSRLGLTALAALLTFLAGVSYWQERTAAQLDELNARHQLRVEQLHAGYKEQADKELERQQKVNAEVLAKAKQERVELVEERKKLHAERKKLIEESKHDKDADRPALGVDAVDRLNRLRHDPGRPGRPKTKGTVRAKPAT